jgi:TatA/E family protein of Tat protein translocase
MGPFGFGEIIFLFFIALVIFGPKKLPELGKTVGKGLREFKKASDELKSNWEQHVREADNPVNDLKQTFSEIKTDVESATRLEDDVTPTPTPAAPEETKPDAN